MADENYSELTAIEELTDIKILSELLNDKDISLKTELKNPLAITRLEIFAMCIDTEFSRHGITSNFEKEEVTTCAEIIMKFVNIYKQNMVSYKRKSRKEIIEAIANLKKEERSFTDKALGK